MYDALTELADLSLQLQKRSVTIPVAHRAIGRQVAVFEATCSKPGPRLQEVDDALKMVLRCTVAVTVTYESIVNILQKSGRKLEE